MDYKNLIRLADEARKKAYVPYSGYRVGACVVTDSGEMYTGCNIENAAFTPTICAERTAIFKAVSEGHRRITHIAVIAGENMGYPCGVCRQVMEEFAHDAEIIVAKDLDTYEVHPLVELLPHGFGPAALEEEKDV